MKSLLAILHLLPLPVGTAFLLVRSLGLSELAAGADEAKRPRLLRRIFLADTVWGLAAAVWMITGFLRAFGPYEKGAAYYLHTPWFHLKLTVFLLIWILELPVMIALIRWRVATARNQSFDASRARLYGGLGHAEAGLLLLMVAAAVLMARGGFH